MKILCKSLGGSHAYGLNTPESDIDYRGVFVNTEINKVIGLDRFEHQDIKREEEDSFYFEVRHFLCSLRKTNTMVIELLFTDNFISTSDEWELIKANRFGLLDSNKFYKSLKGYIFGERRLVNGERSGKLGGKRKAALDEYGYSPKNAVQCLRLAWAGAHFFRECVFPVYIPMFNSDIAEQLKRIKIRPDNIKKKTLIY